MTDLFIQVLNMSITASFIIVAVFLIRWFMQRLRMPTPFLHQLWWAVWLRFTLPFSFQSSHSILNWCQWSAGLPDARIHPLGGYLTVASYVWLTGIVLLLVYHTHSYFALVSRLRLATRVKGRVFETDQITTPFVCGFFRPRIYIPFGLEEREQAHILAHEQTHLRHWDHLTKPLFFAVVILHWFNPFAWAALLLMGKDMEKACDEKVINQLGSETRKGYAHTLLSLSSRRSGLPVGSALFFGEGHIKDRIRNVLRYQQPRTVKNIFAGAVTTLLLLALMGNPIVDTAGSSLAPPTSVTARTDSV